MTRVLVIDNYDSFTYNLVQYLGELGVEPIVVRNDAITIDEARALSPDGVLLSPGPGRPEDAGMLCAAITAFAGVVPVLGVCLGHQAIAEVFGGKLLNLKTVYHGVANKLIFEHVDCTLFNKLKSGISVGRYHSWIVDDENFPNELEVTARDENGYIMALQHKHYDVQGVQFHPESILTPDGETIIKNWIYK